MQVFRHCSEEFLNKFPNPIIIISLDTSILYVNPAFEELTGYSIPEIVGVKAPYPFWRKGNIKKNYRRLMLDVIRPAKFETLHRKKNGGNFYVNVSSQPIELNGDIKFILINWVDITHRKSDRRKKLYMLRKVNKELRTLYLNSQSVRETERGQIAREVHDGIGQALTALKMEICWLEKKLLDVDEPIKKTIQYLNTMVDDTLQRVKWLTAELRPHMLDEIGLADAVEWLTSEFQNITGISCSISVDHEINDLSKDHSSMIFRVVQEALRNVFHHAEATKVLICLKRMNSSIYLKIKDNGKGMSKDKTFSPGSFGLIGMREYITGCGGLLKINSILKRGTTISARIPLKKEAIYGNKGTYR